ncbi:MAG: ABC transporter permease subunit [Bdellovibrionaceae bacterium]|nr:ABC transporter permease subunit [Pseudobdellovibrionaceae bacterium]MBX3034488.1 ABC transporter permease subunit [Pseudobdellovibrionaceae bacterium]
MRGTLVIAGKELRGFFASPTFYVMLFLITLIMSYIYPIQLTLFNQMLMSYVMQPGMPQQQLNIHYGLFLRLLSYLNLMLIFIVPALTMKLIAEEKKMRTFDLLLTSPVKSVDIVLGKYLAALGAILGIMGVAFLYPLVTASFATVNWAPLVISFIGIFLVAGVYAAMDLFCSSLTESALVAYVMSVMMNVSIWFIGLSAEVVDSQKARQVFEHLSLNTHLAGLVEGTVRTSGLVFLLSLVILFIFLAERVVESSRWRA